MFLHLFHSFDETIQCATVVYVFPRATVFAIITYQRQALAAMCANILIFDVRVIGEKRATSSNQLLDKPEMTEELISCCKERLCLGH